MDIYLNDSIKSFEFVLKGDLTAGSVQNLEQAWITAASILGWQKDFRGSVRFDGRG